MARTCGRAADAAERRAQAEDAKVSALNDKLTRLARDRRSAEESLDREVRATARREEERRKAEARRREQEDSRRRTAEKAHAREVARLAQPTLRYVHEVRTIPSPKPERLRVLYLTANPEMDLRTEVEVRQVQDAVRKAKYRDLVEIAYRPAATPEDLLDGLNDIRPHIVHLSGHGGEGMVVFDNASVTTPRGRMVTLDRLARGLAATDSPPRLLLLTACDTLARAAVLLESVPVVIAMTTNISDVAAIVFATRFYAALASGQPVSVAVKQGRVAVEFTGLEESWTPNLLARNDVALDELVLVQNSGAAA
jgi:hypothetical protein